MAFLRRSNNPTLPLVYDVTEKPAPGFPQHRRGLRVPGRAADRPGQEPSRGDRRLSAERPRPARDGAAFTLAAGGCAD